MNELLERHIRSNWYDIKNLPLKYHSIQKLLPIKNEVLISTVQELSLTNENLALFKQNLIHALFFSLEEAQYQSLNTDELRTQSNEMKRVLFLILLQRLVILELLNKPNGASSYTNTDNRLNISEIINDLKSRMIKNPELRNNISVKTILIKIRQYQNEKTKLTEILQRCTVDQRKKIAENSRMTFNQILNSIYINYSKLVQTNEKSQLGSLSETKDRKATNTQINSILLKEAELCSTFISTVSFAANEKYKVRQLLKSLENGKQNLTKLFEQENQIISSITGKDFSQSNIKKQIVNGINLHYLNQS